MSGTAEKHKLLAWTALFLLAALPLLPQIELPDWNQLAQNWANFVDEPSDQNLDSFLNSLPLQGRFVFNDEGVFVSSLKQNFILLENRVFDSNRQAVKVMMRLFNVADNDLNRRLARTLGTFIGYNTRMLLEEMQEHRDLIPGGIETILGSYRLDNGDNPEAQELEKKYRINILESFDDRALRSLARECVRILKRL